MASTCKLGLLITMLVVVSNASVAISSENDFKRCENIVVNWATAALVDGPQGDKLTLRDLLFFLHIPRTGGRTYFQCFLRKLYTSDQECPRSYDKLRFDPSKPNCKLMVTHDDYSMMTKLPKKKTSVITILRNPLDRVFSTYEFSVEVAARFLVHPNLTSATRMTGRVRSKAQGVSTLDIWPWKYLVPWMREDLFARRSARKLKRVTELKDASDSYNMEDMVMPLHLFINDPVAHEIIHNGATFQVAGLTNNSYVEESIKIRHCVRKHPNLGRYVLHVAKKRLEDMLYVGLTEDHKESATMFVNMVGTQVLSMLEALNSRREQPSNNRTDPKSPFLVSEPDSPDQLHTIINNGKPSETRPPETNMNTDRNMTVIKLMEAYEVCVSSLRKSQGSRRAGSLKRISPANFSKEARLGVSETVIEEILSLNSLDVELYKHAQDIFAKQRVHLEQKLVKVQEKMQLNRWRNNSFESNYPPWKVTGLAVAGLLLIASVFLVNSKRRNSKVKV